MSQEAQKSTAAASSFFLRGGSLALSSVSSEGYRFVSESFAAETESVGGFLSA